MVSRTLTLVVAGLVSAFSFLVLLPTPTPAASANDARAVKGYVFELQPDGGFLLDDGVRVLPPAGPSGPGVLVGQQVEVSGHSDPASGWLRASRINILSQPEREVAGTAMVEEVREVDDGLLLLADGRRLFVRDPALLMEGRQTAPGDYVEYHGHWGETGAVELDRLARWANDLEEKEKEIQQRFEPHVVMPADAGNQPAVLRVGRSGYRLVEDVEIQGYVQRLGQQLLPANHRGERRESSSGPTLWFLAVQHAAPQATAYPSGVVVVHSGLFHFAENEAQLAFVVAHELAHVTQEHSWRTFRYRRKELLALRWSTAGIGYLVEKAIRRGYERELESQADRLALWFMFQAGYDPREAVRFLQKLEANQQGLSSIFWETHRGYGSRWKDVMKELVHYSARGVAYPSLQRDAPEFLAARNHLPTVRVVAEE